MKRRNIDRIIEDLKKYPEVVTIILYGFHAKCKEKPLSDIDMAVILKEKNKNLEAEASSFSSNVLDVVPFHRLPLYIQFEVLNYDKFSRDKEYFMDVKRSILRDYLEMPYLYNSMSRSILTQISPTLIISRIERHKEKVIELVEEGVSDYQVF